MHGVGLHDGGSGGLDDRRAGRARGAVSISIGGHLGAGLQQGQRERPEPRADLDDAVAGPDPGQAHDAAHGVGVGHEVLPQRPRRPAARARPAGPGWPTGEWVTAASLAGPGADVPRGGPQR